MGFRFSGLKLVSKALDGRNLNEAKILTLGVQDCYFTYNQLIAFLDRHNLSYTPQTSGDIEYTTGFAWVPDGQKHKYESYIHQNTLFRTLGFKGENIYSLDASEYENPRITHDLNKPVPESLHNQFDVIIDGGTLEHVFSIPMAMQNLIQMCKVGGVLVHYSPSDMLNHGFYNFNAELFDDAYAQNGFERRESLYIISPVSKSKIDTYYFQIAPERLSISLRPNCSIGYFGIHQKLKVQQFQIPQQGYYQSFWNKNPSSAERKSAPNKARKILVTMLDSVPAIAALIRQRRALRSATRVTL